MSSELDLIAPTRPPEFEEDVRCPNCGSYGAQGWMYLRDKATGQVYDAQPPLETRTLVLTFIVSGVLLGVLAGPISSAWAPWIGLAGGALVTLARTAIHTWRAVRREVASVRMRRYRCKRCLHLWDWAEGRPQPNVRTRQEIREDYLAVFGERADDRPPTTDD